MLLLLLKVLVLDKVGITAVVLRSLLQLRWCHRHSDRLLRAWLHWLCFLVVEVDWALLDLHFLDSRTWVSAHDHGGWLGLRPAGRLIKVHTADLELRIGWGHLEKVFLLASYLALALRLLTLLYKLLCCTLPMTLDKLVKGTVAAIPRITTLSKFKASCQLCVVIVWACVCSDSILATDEVAGLRICAGISLASGQRPTRSTNIQVLTVIIPTALA